METSSFTVEYTLTVKTCIEHIASYLRQAEVAPRPVIEKILEQFETRVKQYPLSCQICPELLKIGCAKYRECNTPEGYRVLYSVEGSTITAHAVLAHRQDIQQLLFKRLIQA